MSKKTLLLVALIGLFVGAALATIVRDYLIPSMGVISTASASLEWLDGTPVETLDWGTTENGTTYILEPINITNTGTIPITLELTPTNLSPSIITITLTWNYTGSPLNPSEWIIVEITQTCTATGPYTYTTDIKITEA